MHFSASLAQFIKLSFKMKHISTHSIFSLLLALCLGQLTVSVYHSWFAFLHFKDRCWSGKLSSRLC